MTQFPFVDKHTAASELGVSYSTLKVWRIGTVAPAGDTVPPKLQEGIHWRRHGLRKVTYNINLLQDWAANQDSPEAHQRAIDAYLASLPSSKAAA
jgi:hypothetical protein